MRVKVSEILKKKPKGFEFYSLLHGKNVYLEGVNDTIILFSVKEGDNNIRDCVNGYGELYDNGECVIFPSSTERNWNNVTCEENEEYSFQVGETIIYKNNVEDKRHFHITEINEKEYVLESVYTKEEIRIPIIEIDKFDYPSRDIDYFNYYYFLKPFDKVLCRDSNNEEWKIELFSNFNPRLHYPFECLNASYKQCVLYKDNIELLKTVNKQPKNYITLFKEEEY